MDRPIFLSTPLTNKSTKERNRKAGAGSIFDLPLRLLAIQESLQYSNPLFQSLDASFQSGLGFSSILTEFGVEVFSVGCGRHCCTKYRLNEEVVMRLQGGAVSCLER